MDHKLRSIILDALKLLTLRQLILNSMSFSQARLKSPPIIIRIQDAIVAITAKTTKNLIMRISFGILNIESVRGIQLLSKYYMDTCRQYNNVTNITLGFCPILQYNNKENSCRL